MFWVLLVLGNAWEWVVSREIADREYSNQILADAVAYASLGFSPLLGPQVVGLGASGRAAVKLALARGADVVALDSNPACLPLEVGLLIILGGFISFSIVCLFSLVVKALLLKRA